MAWRGTRATVNPPEGQAYTTWRTTPRVLMPTKIMGSQVLPGAHDGVPGRAAPGTSGRAQGNNPDVSTVPVVPPPKRPLGRTWLGVGQESSYRGRLFGANDGLTTFDRHAFLKAGTELTGRKSGQTDPPMDGPARPSLAIVQRTISFMMGSDNTGNQDDLTRDFSRNDQGMYVGQQDNSRVPVYGGVPGLWQPYGSYAGHTAGHTKGIQSPVPYGSVADRPRNIHSGPAHGLHSPTYPDNAQILGRYIANRQMKAPRVDRPNNSMIAGQSYSQTVQSQGATGPAKATSAAFSARKTGGWRGA